MATEAPDMDAAAIEAAAKPSIQYDISTTLAKYLDPHLLFPVLSFLETLQIYNPADLASAMYTLARKTNMSDYIIQAYKKVHGEEAEVPKELEDEKLRVEEEWRKHMSAIGPLADLLAFADEATGEKGEDLSALLDEGRFTPEVLAENYGVAQEHIDALFACAKFRYECGEYDWAAHYLEHYRMLVPDTDDSTRALWGKFAADTVGMRFDEADKDRALLQGRIGRAGSSNTELEVLQQRTWLLHWSLFVFVNRDKSKDTLIEFFTSDTHLNTIQLNCPWLLRYLSAAVLTSTDNRKRHGVLKQLLRVIGSDALSYRDPIIEFLEALLLNFDFDGAQAKLAECESVIVTDYFLSYLTSPHEFMESARRIIFETYCRIHQKIGLDMLSKKLHMSEVDAEKWVVELIRSASLDAKIDSTERQVIMMVPQTSVYSQVLSKTHDLTQRVRALAENIDTALAEAASTPAKEIVGGGAAAVPQGSSAGRAGGRP